MSEQALTLPGDPGYLTLAPSRLYEDWCGAECPQLTTWPWLCSRSPYHEGDQAAHINEDRRPQVYRWPAVCVDPVQVLVEERGASVLTPATSAELGTARKVEQHGCVTNFYMGEKRVTVWRYPGSVPHYSLLIDSVHVEPREADPAAFFQAVAEELHRLGSLVGLLKRRLIESGVPLHVVDAIEKEAKL